MLPGPPPGPALEDATLGPHQIADEPTFADARGQRLLAVDVLPGPGGGDGDQRVPVIRGRDHDRVDVVPREQLAEIAGAVTRFQARDLQPRRAVAASTSQTATGSTRSSLRNDRRFPAPVPPTPMSPMRHPLARGDPAVLAQHRPGHHEGGDPAKARTRQKLPSSHNHRPSFASSWALARTSASPTSAPPRRLLSSAASMNVKSSIVSAAGTGGSPDLKNSTTLTTSGAYPS